MFIAPILCRYPNSGAAWLAGAAASLALTADLAGLTKAKMPEGRARALSGPERDETSKEVRRRRGTGFRFRPPLRRRPTASVFTECCISATTGHSLCGRWDASLGTPELPQPCRSSAEIARRDADIASAINSIRLWKTGIVQARRQWCSLAITLHATGY
jgi:hypothetical protein